MGLLVLLNIGLLGFILLVQWDEVLQSAGIVLAEMLYLLPVLIILAWRRVSWKISASGGSMRSPWAWGAAARWPGYVFIILHNLVLMALGVDTQGERDA